MPNRNGIAARILFFFLAVAKEAPPTAISPPLAMKLAGAEKHIV
jgi:hypothetical protein